MAHAPRFTLTAAQVAALGVAALVLAACGGQARGTITTVTPTSTQTTGSLQPSTEPTTKAPTATATEAGTEADDQAAPATNTWAGTKQFMQIERARDANGTTFLNVRRAEKEILGESFETVTIEGPWTEVAMAADAVNVPLKRVGVEAKPLPVALKRRTFSQLKEGFDITFNKKGEISEVRWLYVL